MIAFTWPIHRERISSRWAGKRSHSFVVVVALSLLSASNAHSQAMSEPRNAAVDKLFQRWYSSSSPGCAVGVYRENMIVYQRGYGMADLDHDIPIGPSSVFHVASMSKQFTAAAILLLAQEGKLSLDDDVHKYVPELPNFGTTITIRHLIHHTSGLRDQWRLLMLAGWRYSQDLITDDDVMSLVTRQKELEFKPGEKHMYSNTGYTLLGLIVRRVSGMSLREFTTRNIFEPLGMNSTHFRDDHSEIVKNIAYGYELGTDKAQHLSVTNFDTVGATSLLTTVKDLQRWDENFYNARVGGPDLIRQMLEPGKLNNGEILNYASGLVIGTYKGLRTVDHAGGDAGYRADLTRFPDQHFSVAVLCNSADIDPSRLVREVADVFLAKQEKELVPETSDLTATKIPSTVTPSKEQLKALTGLFWNRDDDQYLKIALVDGKLQLSFWWNSFMLEPVSETLFHMFEGANQVDVRFEGTAKESTNRITLTYPHDRPAEYESVSQFVPTSNELTEYAGNYRSDELDSYYRMVFERGKLVLWLYKHKPKALDPTVHDSFLSDAGNIRFVRDSAGQVYGFLLTRGGLHNLRFTKAKE